MKIVLYLILICGLIATELINLTYSAYGHLYLVIGFDLAMQGSIRLYLGCKAIYM
jgi:hypothetical protein